VPTRENAPDFFIWDSTRYTDWQEKFIGGTGKYSDMQVAFSGGSTQIQYLVGGNFHKEVSVFPGSFTTQRGGAHFSLSGNSANQKLKTVLTSSYSFTSNKNPSADFSEYLDLPPNAPEPYNKNGTLNWAESSWQNPYAQLVSSIQEPKISNLLSSLDISYRFLPGLVAKISGSYNDIRSNTFSGNTIAGQNLEANPTATASAIFNNYFTRSWIVEPQLNYNYNHGGGTLSLLTGATISGTSNDGQTIIAFDIQDDAVIRNLAAASNYRGFITGNEYKYAAVFSRVGYNLKDKYLLNVTLRRDGSSRFGDNKKFSNFYAVGGAWIFSEEKFIQRNLHFLTFGKIRASYGITGNDQIGDYGYLDRYEFMPRPYQNRTLLQVMQVYNADFSWEKTKKFETGLEFGALKNRLLLNVSYFENRSGNQLLDLVLPSITGTTSIIGNLPAVVQNTGWEFVLTTRNIQTKSFSWTTSINTSLNKNKYLSYNGIGNPNAGVGRAITYRDIYKFVSVDPASGRYLFADIDGKPVLADQAYFLADSVNTAPKYFGGIQNSLQWKGFQLDMIFQYVKQLGNSGLFHRPQPFIPGQLRNQRIEVLQRWQKPGDIAKYQKFSQSFDLMGDYFTWLSNSTASYVDASFISCRNVSLSWKFPSTWLSNLKLNTARVYLQAQNLFIISPNYDGWSPETQSSTSIPPLRVVTAGIQLIF